MKVFIISGNDPRQGDGGEPKLIWVHAVQEIITAESMEQAKRAMSYKYPNVQDMEAKEVKS